MGYAAAGDVAAAAIFNNTTLYPSYPSGVVSSSPLFLLVSHSNAAAAAGGALTVPATFQLIVGSSINVSRARVYYTKASAAVSSTVVISVSISTTSTAGNWKASMVRWTDIVASTTGLIAVSTNAGASSTAYAADLTITRAPANAIQFVSVATTGTAAVTSFTGETGADYVQQLGSTAQFVQHSYQQALLASTAAITGGAMPVGLATWITLGIAWDTISEEVYTANTDQAFGPLEQFAQGGPGVGGSLVQAFGSLQQFAQGGPGVGGSLVQAFGSMSLAAIMGIDIEASAQNTFGSLDVFGRLGIDVNASLQQTFGSVQVESVGEAEYEVINPFGRFGSLTVAAVADAAIDAILHYPSFPSMSIHGTVEADYEAVLDKQFPSLSAFSYVDAGVSTGVQERSFVYRGFHRRMRSQERK